MDAVRKQPFPFQLRMMKLRPSLASYSVSDQIPECRVASIENTLGRADGCRHCCARHAGIPDDTTQRIFNRSDVTLRFGWIQCGFTLTGEKSAPVQYVTVIQQCRKVTTNMLGYFHPSDLRVPLAAPTNMLCGFSS